MWSFVVYMIFGGLLKWLMDLWGFRTDAAFGLALLGGAAVVKVARIVKAQRGSTDV